MMTAEQLRGAILQLAVQGKLVEQDASDEAAAILIQNILKRKRHLIEQNELKKEKKLLPIVEYEIPFDIPESWEWIRLGDYAEKVTDYVASGSFASLRENAPSLKTEDYAILVKTADFANGFTRNLTYTTKNGYDFLSNSNLFGGELVLSNIGSIGKVFIVPKLEKKMTLAPNSVMIRLTDDQLRDYLYYFLLSPTGFDELISITSGTAMKKFNKTDLKTILVPVPPLAEQKRIVAKIEELMPFVEQYMAASTKLNTLNTTFPDMMKKSILQEAVQGKLVPQDPNDEPASELLKRIAEEKQRLIKEGKIKKQKALPEITEEEIPFDIPESWEWVRLQDLFHKIEAGKSKKCHEKPPGQDEHGIIKVSAVTWGEFQESESKTCLSDLDWNPEYQIKNNDFLITRANTKQLVGACVIVSNIKKNLMLSDKTLRIVFSRLLNEKFILYSLRSGYLRSQIEGKATGTSDSMKNISQGTISELLVALPPYPEQCRIVKSLEHVLLEISF